MNKYKDPLTGNLMDSDCEHYKSNNRCDYPGWFFYECNYNNCPKKKNKL